MLTMEKSHSSTILTAYIDFDISSKWSKCHHFVIFLKSKTRPWKSVSEIFSSLNLFSRSIWLFFRVYLDFLSLGILFVSRLTAWNSNFFRLSGFGGPSGRPIPSNPIIICIFGYFSFKFAMVFWNVILIFDSSWSNFGLITASKSEFSRLSGL